MKFKVTNQYRVTKDGEKELVRRMKSGKYADEAEALEEMRLDVLGQKFSV